MKPNKLQEQALKALDNTSAKKGTVVMPTASGKTFMAVLWVKKILEKEPKAKLLFICHNNDILKQANETEFQTGLKQIGIKDSDCGYYNAAHKDDKQITFGTVQTLGRNLNKLAQDKYDYIIVDECHHYTAKTFKAVLNHFTPKFMLGLTATPGRMDGVSINKIFDETIYHADTKKGIKQGILSKFKYYNVENDIDFSRVKVKSSGKYDATDLNKHLCIVEYDNAILKEYNKYKQKHNLKKTIVFCATVKHAERMCNMFERNGIKSVTFAGTKQWNQKKLHWVSSKERERILADFVNGKYETIFVRDLFNEGVNIPDADCIMFLRPTESHTVFQQQLGRGLRKAKGKDYLICLDFTGNSNRCYLNFQTLGKMLDFNVGEFIDGTTSNESFKNREKKDFIIESLGCEVVLTRKKMNILKHAFRNLQLKKGEIESWKKSIINKYKEYLQLNSGKIISCADFCKKQGISKQRITKYFGSWNNFRREVGDKIEYRKRFRWNREALEKLYNIVKLKLRHAPSAKEIAKIGGVDVGTFKSHFGSWNKFKQSQNDERTRVSKESIIKQLQEFNRKHGKFPTVRDARKHRLITDNTVRKLFGSYTKAIIEAGGAGKKFTKSCLSKKQIYSDYLDVKKKLGKVPYSYEVSKEVPYSFEYALPVYFGCGYTEFLKKIGDYEELRKRFNKLKGNTGQKWKLSNVCNTWKKLKKTIQRNPTRLELRNRKFKTLPPISTLAKLLKLKGKSYKQIVKAINKPISSNKKRITSKQKNVKFETRYKPVNEVQKEELNRPKIQQKSTKNRKRISAIAYKTSQEKNKIRPQIISKINSGETILVLESPNLDTIKEMERQKIVPNKIIIPNDKEYRKLCNALNNYKTTLNIEVVNTSALQYLADTTEKLDYIWLDYCGAFGYYRKDLEIALSKFKNMKLIVTYNLFDLEHQNDGYYFTAVIDYVLERANRVRIFKDISYKYKRNFYNIGFAIGKQIINRNGRPRGSIKFSSEQIKFLTENKDVHYMKLTKLFNEKYGTNYKENTRALYNILYRLGIIKPINQILSEVKA